MVPAESRFIPARPTVYKGIQMRSRLEAAWAQAIDTREYIDEDDVIWEYEPKCFANHAGQYLPDFLVQCGEHREYLEVKPLIITVHDLRYTQEQMEIIWSTEPDVHLTLACGHPAREVVTFESPGKGLGWWQP